MLATPLLFRLADAHVCHFPLRSAWRRTPPEVTALPVDRLKYRTVTLVLAPQRMFLELTVVPTPGLALAAAAAWTIGVAALAAGVATSCPAQRQRPRDSAAVPVPTARRRRRLELCSCTVRESLRHACEVSCRVRAGRNARPPFGGFTPRLPRTSPPERVARSGPVMGPPSLPPDAYVNLCGAVVAPNGPGQGSA